MRTCLTQAFPGDTVVGGGGDPEPPSGGASVTSIRPAARRSVAEVFATIQESQHFAEAWTSAFPYTLMTGDFDT